MEGEGEGVLESMLLQQEHNVQSQIEQCSAQCAWSQWAFGRKRSFHIPERPQSQLQLAAYTWWKSAQAVSKR